MRTRDFFDQDHAHRYLSQSVITVNKKPAYITAAQKADQGYLLHYMSLPLIDLHSSTKEIHYTLHNRDDVDMNPLPLGMLAVNKGDNKKAQSVYLSRVPARAWKIGLTEWNLNLYDIAESKFHHNYSPKTIFYTNHFINTVNGKYPTLAEAMQLSKERSLPIAFSRRFAVNDKKLLYKTLQVPVGEMQDSTPVLLDCFKHLTQVLNEDNNG